MFWLFAWSTQMLIFVSVLSSPPYWQLPCPGKLFQTPRIFWNLNLKKTSETSNLSLWTFVSIILISLLVSLSFLLLIWLIFKDTNMANKPQTYFFFNIACGKPAMEESKGQSCLHRFLFNALIGRQSFRYFVLDLCPRRNCPYSLLIVVSWGFINGISDPTIPGRNICVLFRVWRLCEPCPSFHADFSWGAVCTGLLTPMNCIPKLVLRPFQGKNPQENC